MAVQTAGSRQHSVEQGAKIRIQAIQTGRVRVRTRQVEGSGSGTTRLMSTMLDRNWSPWLPIHAWLIEHPEGLIVVDTGETARTAEPGYFPWWHPYYRLGVDFDVAPDQEIGPQLRSRGIEPADVHTVVMTHLHTDHAGGLGHFPNSEILIARREYEVASGLPGRLRGFLPQRWPDWLNPHLVDFDDDPYGPFTQSRVITRAGDVVLVPTPGHSAGHLSVIVKSGSRRFFLAGDTSYTEDLMLSGSVDGVAPDEEQASQTLATIREFAASASVVYLPSHDPESAERLESGRVVPGDLAASAPVGANAVVR